MQLKGTSSTSCLHIQQMPLIFVVARHVRLQKLRPQCFAANSFLSWAVASWASAASSRPADPLAHESRGSSCRNTA
ncbi:hypothetical protein SORBI_3001G052350 [Sorghum bicolor]|uniref:Uncharacterized protein n=1 Tax=Sorghum bicolor TaxID=4558 RepID=A0A1Z5S4E1_SORBI|nr:hypothetical protein SORBI_3001G052350 [Sorghum bicolor]